MSATVAISQVKDGSQYSTDPQELPQVQLNRLKWFSVLGLSLDNTVRVVMSYERSDYCAYREVSFSDKGLGIVREATEMSDALVTKDKGLILFLPVADCIATTLYDPKTETLMLSHLGRHSLEQNGAYKSVKHLVDNYGADARDLQIWLSPAPAREFYPIYTLDNIGMKDAVMAQLKEAGVGNGQITDSPEDTVTDGRYYSHTAFLRGEQSTDGRYAMIAVMN
ncbi:polyphenol oxidase family protein [Candidatus Saccharibacteria bacterium]|nr:polyphenol oxidase family protein [Candidatus Saccharibacteria bacterium]NCS82983.1 polyphenol oxidase family protein [Candidatus Saccharibacteria bacterium]